jgi:hypothetical protein
VSAHVSSPFDLPHLMPPKSRGTRPRVIQMDESLELVSSPASLSKLDNQLAVPLEQSHGPMSIENGRA